MGNITYQDSVSIAEIAVYLPALIIACCLAICHGFSRNSGWIFLIVFCLARIIGPFGLILGIVRDINANDAIKNGAPYHPGTLSKAGTALIAVSYVLLVTFCAFTYSSVERAELGEKRLFLANEFNLLTGNVTVLVCAALLPELISVVIFETMGLTLQKTVKEEHIEAAQPTCRQSSDSDSPMETKKQSGGDSGDNVFLNIAKKTIIGRIVMSL
ncbi:hypothetical protein D0Z07_4626 [Hyphodiscus hymeniophilus]|uniref:DUF7702 domain-containing protein n=1 Tax=Hyphodiscus hymeniophilus TaxID=353542 RepID=A0A9P6VIM7_9HELO|nr:hypothetical protein D0Z07_4626 [Hyphodiscus hymeniophilus]